jgi:hypothetical protein
MLSVGIQVSVKHKDPALLVGTPMAIATMHFTWGAALVWGLIKSK